MLAQVRALASGLDRDQIVWTSGYLAALAQQANALARPEFAAVAESRQPLFWTVFFASETGNSKGVAESLNRRCHEIGITTKLQDLQGFRPHRLNKLQRAIFVIATHGLGDPPEGTEAFFEFWFGEQAPRIENLEYAVLALGDSSYADFCEIGHRLDLRLAELGAQRFAERVDCDLNYKPASEKWTLELLQKAERLTDAPGTGTPHLHAVEGGPTTPRNTSFRSSVLANQPITGRGSSKDVRHIELDIEDSGLSYLPGDSLAVMPKNPPQLVESLLSDLRLDGDSPVTVNSKTVSLSTALREDLEITVLSQPLLKALSSAHSQLAEQLANRDYLRELLRTHQVIDLVNEYPLEWDAQVFVDSLRDLPPRFYSIASSPDANPGEVHLTVSLVNYERFGRTHWGAASSFMADNPESLEVYVEPNEHFRLPEDPHTRIIMVGAGTGIAPYRAFVEHRREHGHTGENWLIFGDRNFSTDFLYQAEWLEFREQGFLKRIDLAFSRDGAQKVYVQHRIGGQGKRLYEWIVQGAHIYVCGDAHAMAGDVHSAILEVLQEQGSLSEEAAREQISQLRASGRYQRDVY